MPDNMYTTDKSKPLTIQCLQNGRIDYLYSGWMSVVPLRGFECELVTILKAETVGPLPQSVTPSLLFEAEIEEGSDHKNWIIDYDAEPLYNEPSRRDNNTFESIKSTHDNDKPTASSTINLEEMVQQQETMIKLLFQPKTELLELCGSSTSDVNDKYTMAQPKHFSSSGQELETYHRSPR
jgi:hypothetical protein